MRAAPYPPRPSPRAAWRHGLRAWRTALAALLVLAPSLAGADVELQVAPQPLVLDQSCELSFRVTGEVRGEPDFSPLADAFEIIARNRKSSLNWTNGRREQSTTWVLSALPRRSGSIEIPSIRFGSQHSPARTLEVRERPRQNADRPDIVLEVEARPHAPYVQQQVIYTVRLLHRVELSNPRFSPLATSSDALVKRLGDGRQYVDEVDGVSYDVFEQRYAVFPQTSGTLTIEPLVLTTQIVSGARPLLNPFRQSLHTRRVESRAVTLDVRPIPAAFPAGATWLPARRLRLHEEWVPDVARTDSGTPLSRTLFVWADGLVAGQLPELDVAMPDGVRSYPDQAQRNEKDTASGFTAVLQRKFAVIGSRPGAVSFPAVTLPWWNTETDRLETATLPARPLTFTASAAGAPAHDEPGAATAAAEPAAAPERAAAPAASAPQLPRSAWMTATGALAAAWLLTLLAWWRARSAAPATHDVQRATDREAERGAAHRADAARRLKSACAADDAAGARDALLAWARAQQTGRACRSLRDVAACCETAALADAVGDLQRALYAPRADAWRGATLWQAFRREPRHRRAAAAHTGAALPALFRLVSSDK